MGKSIRMDTHTHVDPLCSRCMYMYMHLHIHVHAPTYLRVSVSVSVCVSHSSRDSSPELPSVSRNLSLIDDSLLDDTFTSHGTITPTGSLGNSEHHLATTRGSVYAQKISENAIYSLFSVAPPQCPAVTVT